MEHLTGIQRDLLYVVESVGEAKGLTLRDELERYYEKDVPTSRIYPNLDTLCEQGYVAKGSMDNRTNAYRLTETGDRFLEDRRNWEARLRS